MFRKAYVTVRGVGTGSEHETQQRRYEIGDVSRERKK